MATDLSLITPTVKPYIPDCLEPVIAQFVHLAAVELCRRSLKWTEKKDAASVDSTSFPYSVPATTGTRIVKVLSVFVDGLALERSDVGSEEALDGDWRSTTGTPSRFVEESSGVLTLVPLPSVAIEMRVEVALEPSADGTTIDDTVYAEHWKDIKAGAIAELCVMPGKPWTDANVAIYNRDIFERGIANSKVATHFHRRVGGMLTKPCDI